MYTCKEVINALFYTSSYVFFSSFLGNNVPFAYTVKFCFAEIIPEVDPHKTIRVSKSRGFLRCRTICKHIA